MALIGLTGHYIAATFGEADANVVTGTASLLKERHPCHSLLWIWSMVRSIKIRKLKIELQSMC